MKFRSLAFASLLALAAPACAVQSPDLVDPAEDTGVAASAAAVTKLYASEGDLDLIVETLGTFEERDGVRALILHATANRYLEDVYTYVPDDLFGEAHIISERRLEIVLHEGHELNTVLSGLPLFVAVNTFTGSPNQYTAKIVVAPRFYDFRGATGIFIEEEVEPVYVVNGTSHLTYRGGVNALASSLTVTAPDGAPTVTSVDADSFNLDWSYASLHQAIDPHTVPLTFTAALTSGTALKTSRLVARVVDLALTSGDAYDVWPTPECQPAVYSCIQAQPTGATDFAACGSYRQVTRCLYANACDVVPPAPLSLTAIDASSLEPARDAWNIGSNNGAWHELTSLDAFSTPACPAAPVTIQSVMAQIAPEGQDQPPAGDYGTFTDRSGLAQSVFFAANYYGDGVALLAAIDAFAGGGAVQAWLSVNELSCHNCHDFGARAVLYYPATGKVIVLDGHYGYDS
jgi:hypothetical protein